MNIAKKFKDFFKKRPLFLVVLLYFSITLLFTYPLVNKIGSNIPQGRGDTFQAMANIDSRLAMVTPLDFVGKFKFFAKNINVFAPYVFLNLFFSKYFAYNIMFLASFVLSAVGAYMLTFYFVKNRTAAFIAGLIFAFSPFHYYQATVVNLGTMQQQWLPFMALFLFKFFEKLEFKHFLSFIFFAFLIAMSEHQMLAFSALFIAIVFFYQIFSKKELLRNKKLWLYIASSLILLSIVAFGMFGEMLKVATSENNFLNPGENAANRYSIKILDPIAPPIFHSLWGNLNEKIQQFLLGDLNRGSYFLGFSVICILIYFGLLLFKKKVPEIKVASYKKNVIFWTLTTFLFYIFSLGNSFSIGKTTIYLPYFLIYKFLPFYENIRTTGRMFVFVMLGVSVLCGFAFFQLMKKYQAKKRLLAISFSCFLLLEFWVAPIGTMSVSHSAFYDQIGKDMQQYKLLEIPGSTSYEFASYELYLSTIHKKQVLNGMPLARKIKDEFEMQQTTPIIKQLLYTIPKGNDPQAKNMDDILQGFNFQQANDILNYYNVGYITISKVYAKKDVQKLAENFIQKYIGYSDRFEDSFLIAYKIKKQLPSGFYAQFENGNNQLSSTFKSSEGILEREVGDGAQLKIVNMEAEAKKVQVVFSAKARNSLSFELTGKTINSKKIYQTGREIAKFESEAMLLPGENLLTFRVSDQDGKPVSVSLKKKDPKKALVVEKIEIK